MLVKIQRQANTGTLGATWFAIALMSRLKRDHNNLVVAKDTPTGRPRGLNLKLEEFRWDEVNSGKAILVAVQRRFQEVFCSFEDPPEELTIYPFDLVTEILTIAKWRKQVANMPLSLQARAEIWQALHEFATEIGSYVSEYAGKALQALGSRKLFATAAIEVIWPYAFEVAEILGDYSNKVNALGLDASNVQIACGEFSFGRALEQTATRWRELAADIPYTELISLFGGTKTLLELVLSQLGEEKAPQKLFRSAVEHLSTRVNTILEAMKLSGGKGE